MKINYLKIYYGHTLEGGWLKSRWVDEFEEDARKLGCRNWLASAQGRGRWWHLLEEAKTHPVL
jgi:hypothetical protein